MVSAQPRGTFPAFRCAPAVLMPSRPSVYTSVHFLPALHVFRSLTKRMAFSQLPADHRRPAAGAGPGRHVLRDILLRDGRGDRRVTALPLQSLWIIPTAAVS